MTFQVIRAGAVFDGARVHGPSAIHLENGLIAGLSPADEPLPADALVTDLGADSWVMPGLIDSHVHLAFDAGPDVVASVTEAEDEDLLRQMRASARLALRAGITTVRDLGDRGFLTASLIEELAQAPHEGPEVLMSGPPLTTYGGHCYFLGGETEGIPALRAAVKERVRLGCQVVKVMLSGGTMTPGSAPHLSQYNRAELQTVVEEAHRLGLAVAVHAHGTDAIRDAVAVGVDTIEHASFMTADGVEADEELLTAITVSGTVISLTVGIDPSRGVPDLPPAIAQRIEALTEVYRQLHALGARFVVGTDAGIAPFKPHDVLPYGIAQATAFGLSPLDALKSCTSVAAEACGLSGRKGVIASGADADLLAVTGKPLDDVSRLRKVRAVYRAGVRVR
jgi:imidazolonepropionase-like amidohydrolase